VPLLANWLLPCKLKKPQKPHTVSEISPHILNCEAFGNELLCALTAKHFRLSCNPSVPFFLCALAEHENDKATK
jgi:hypothetical protein